MSGRVSGRAMVAVVVAVVTLLSGCSDDGGGDGDGEPAASATTSAPATTTSSPTTEDEEAAGTPSTVDQGPVPDASTGTGPVDGDHPCGALSVAEVKAVVPGVVGANRNGTSCYYVTQAGDNALAVDVPLTNDDPLEAATQLVSITAQFEPSFDPTGQGCDPVNLASGETSLEASYCTRSSGDSPATLVLLSGTHVIQLLDLTPSTPPDQARLVTLAQTLLPRVL